MRRGGRGCWVVLRQTFLGNHAIYELTRASLRLLRATGQLISLLPPRPDAGWPLDFCIADAADHLGRLPCLSLPVMFQWLVSLSSHLASTVFASSVVQFSMCY